MKSGGGPSLFDVPLARSVEPEPVRIAPPPPSRPSPAHAGAGSLVLAAVADIGVCLLGVASTIVIALAAGVHAAVPLAVAAVAGLLTASFVATGVVWGWRGTPGMVLAGNRAARPLRLSAALRLWTVWLVSLPLLGIPLLVTVAGSRLIDRLAGSRLSALAPPAGA